MQLTKNVVVKQSATQSGTRRRNEETVVREVTAHWSKSENKQLVRLGRILASLNDGVTFAHAVLHGEEVTAENIKALYGVEAKNGISMSNVSTWQCVGCLDAHGTGHGPRSNKSESGLTLNEFYFNPATGAVTSISNTCFPKYVVKCGGPVPQSLEAFKATKKTKTV